MIYPRSESIARFEKVLGNKHEKAATEPSVPPSTPGLHANGWSICSADSLEVSLGHRALCLSIVKTAEKNEDGESTAKSFETPNLATGKTAEWRCDPKLKTAAKTCQNSSSCPDENGDHCGSRCGNGDAETVGVGWVLQKLRHNAEEEEEVNLGGAEKSEAGQDSNVKGSGRSVPWHLTGRGRFYPVGRPGSARPGGNPHSSGWAHGKVALPMADTGLSTMGAKRIATPTCRDHSEEE